MEYFFLYGNGGGFPQIDGSVAEDPGVPLGAEWQDRLMWSGAVPLFGSDAAMRYAELQKKSKGKVSTGRSEDRSVDFCALRRQGAAAQVRLSRHRGCCQPA